MSNQEQFIGRGERVAVEILRCAFPQATIQTQIPIQFAVHPDAFEDYGEIYEKATIDIMMHHKNKLIAVRVQDKHHTGEKTSQKDRIQKDDMKNNDVIVVDLYERECPYLFRNKLNYKSYLEVLLPFEKEGVKP